MIFTKHGAGRCQQRSIRASVVHQVLDFGARAPCGDGCETVYLDKKARESLEAALGKEDYKRLLPDLDIALVVKDGAVVTAMHRTKRLKRR